MRLWHEALIPYLPRQQLLGLHREVCALRGQGWGKPHSVVNYVFEHPMFYLVQYHYKVMIEMQRRGYSVADEWKHPFYRGKIIGYEEVGLGTNEYEFDLFYSMYQSELHGCTTYPEHDDAYLRECLGNLAGKGIFIDMEGMGK